MADNRLNTFLPDSNRKFLQATPRNSLLGYLSDMAAASYSPQRTQQMQGTAKFFGAPAISETLDRLSYGEPLTTGAGGIGGTTRIRPEALEAAMAVAPMMGPAGRAAGATAMGAGRAGERLAERSIPQIMQRGGMGSEMLQGMSRGTVSPLDVYQGSPHKFPPTATNPLGEFDASKIGTGEGAQAYGHGIYTAESKDVGAEYAKVLASPRNRVMDKRGVYIEPSPMGDGMWRLGKSSETGRMIGTTGDATQGITDYQFPNVAAAVRYAKKNGFLSKDENPLLTEIASERNYNPVRSASQMEDSTYNQLIASDPGYLYKVNLPDEQIAKMLDWDKPLSQQPNIMEALTPENMGLTLRQPTDGGFMAYVGINGKPIGLQVKGATPEAFRQKWIDRLTEFGNAEGGAGRAVGYLGGTSTSGELAPVVSGALRQAGIPGIKYLDEGSRNLANTWIVRHPQGGENVFSTKASAEAYLKRNPEGTLIEPKVTRNFVTFPGEEQNLTILERNGQPSQNSLNSFIR